MEKILSIKTNGRVEIIKANVNLDDCLHLDVLENTARLDGETSDFLSQFNSVLWDVKCNIIFPELNNIEENNKQAYIKECLENHFSKLLSERDIKFRDLNFNYINLNNHESEALDIACQLNCFSDMPIPEKTKGFLEPYIEMLYASKGADMEKINKRNIYSYYSEPIRALEEYVIYIGDNLKYKGLIGVIIDTREDAAPNKVSFYPNSEGEKQNNLWTKENNIIRFYI